MSEGWWRSVKGGIEIRVRVTPKASRDAVGTVKAASDGKKHLKIMTRALPDAGAANKAVLAIAARHFGVPKTAVHLVSGAASRIKVLGIMGDAGVLEQFARSNDELDRKQAD